MIKGELFNTEMVTAYLDGRKKHTCRPVKPQPKYIQTLRDGRFETSNDGGFDCDVKYIKPKYRPGDFMYCRETWGKQLCCMFDLSGMCDQCNHMPQFDDEGVMGIGCYAYKATHPNFTEKWHPSIHMPREAARLFFRVTKVEVMRLEDVTEQFAIDDGFLSDAETTLDGNDYSGLYAYDRFMEFWQATYGPDSNWMWVYWTEPCSREEAKGGSDK